MKRIRLIGPLLALLALGSVGCSNEQAGSPQATSDQSGGNTAAAPSSSTAGGEGSANGPLAGTDPCSLLPDSAMAQLQFDQGKREEGEKAGSRTCNYRGPGYGADIVIFDTIGYQRPNVDQRTTPVTINGGRSALKSPGAGGVCDIAMDVSASSSVDVITGARGDVQRACRLAELVARAVEPNLPKN